MKSDHAPLFVKLDFAPTSQQNNQILGTQKKTLSKVKILLNRENREIISAALKRQFQVIKYSMADVTTNEVVSHVHSSFFIPKIHKALRAFKMSHPKKRDTSTFPSYPWYDEKCKATKRYLKETKLSK